MVAKSSTIRILMFFSISSPHMGLLWPFFGFSYRKQAFSIQNQSDPTITKDSGAGDAFNLTEAVAEALDDHFRFADDPVHHKTLGTVTSSDHHADSIPGVFPLGFDSEKIIQP